MGDRDTERETGSRVSRARKAGKPHRSVSVRTKAEPSNMTGQKQEVAYWQGLRLGPLFITRGLQLGNLSADFAPLILRETKPRMENRSKEARRPPPAGWAGGEVWVSSLPLL